MKTSILKKSLLNYAIKGNLSSRFRKSNPNLNAFDEINAYNAQILKDKKSKEKELKELESKLKTQKDKELKQTLKQTIQNLKKEIAKLKSITPLNEDCAPFAIPPTWAWVRLGEVCEELVVGGDKPSEISYNKTDYFKFPIYTNGVKDNGLYGFTNKPFIEKSAITISGRGTIGFICLRYEPFYPIIRLLVAIPNSSIILEYLAYALNPLIPKSSGTSIPQLTIPMIKDISIPLPPLKEQKEIVRTLDTLFALTKGLKCE